MPQSKGCIPWNKGLTKETDERVKRNGENTGKTLRKRGSCKGKNNSMYGKHPISWNTGLTKETDKRVGKQGFKIGDKRNNFKKGLKGIKSSNWKGGEIVNNGYHYKLCYFKNFKKPKYIAQHRLIVEKVINRKLLSSEIIHHKDHNHSNNKIENLQITTRGKHLIYHREYNKGKVREI